MRIAIIGGTFNIGEGKASHIVHNLAISARHKYKGKDQFVFSINGGNLEDLDGLIPWLKMHKYDCLIWMPNIDNKEDKILPTIKKQYPNLLLVQSKRVVEKSYTDFEIVKRLLDSHSSLGIRITRPDEYQFEVLDPLGNSWNEPASLDVMSNVLFGRIKELLALHRKASTQSSELQSSVEVEPEFLDAVKYLGGEFTKYVLAVNPNRFLGNASTRCCHGFPSARKGDVIYMSKRNVDKTIISNDQFVAVGASEGESVLYGGSNKPSVDTPIQQLLYQAYPNVNYMVHGHVYVEGAPMTDKNIPCGFIEEVNEVIDLVPDTQSTNFVINLLGHGCLIFAESIEYLTAHKFKSRPHLEKQYD